MHLLLRMMPVVVTTLQLFSTHKYNKQCSPSEFYSLVKHLGHVHDDLKAFSEMASSDISSELLLQAMKEVLAHVLHPYMYMNMDVDVMQ